jgi:ubiquinone/menaquinone biosynthesis C-methylase UbiE
MKSVSRALLGALFAVALAAQAQAPHTHQHGFSDAQHWAKVFDDPERDAWQKPHEVIQALKLAPDAAVADIGAGTGYFAVRLAHMVSKGQVYAVDIEPDMVKYLTERAHKSGLQNLTPVLGKPDDPMLPAKVDLALMVDTYHHVGDRVAYFKRVAGKLKPGGAVAIIDFTKESKIGPPPSSRIAASEVKSEMQRAGYALAAEHNFLPNQYFLVFRPR